MWFRNSSKWLLSFMFWSCYTSVQQNNSDCVCVLSFLCNDTDISSGLIDIALPDTSCPHYLEKCCKKDNVVVIDKLPTHPKQIECGHSHPDGIGFKVQSTDNEAQFGEFPWMVAVLHKAYNASKHLYKCGGSLIHPQVVLTAAHCVTDKANTFKIRAGEWDSITTTEPFDHEDREVVSVLVHPQFHNRTLHNDIALLFLKDAVTISDHINTVCLPAQDAIASGNDCIVTGWGKDSFDREGALQVILKKVQLPIVSKEVCQDVLRETRLGSTFKLHPTFMCAGGKVDKDACIGDGGGPLVCQVDSKGNRYQQVGVLTIYIL